MALDPTKNPNFQFLQRLSKDNPIKILLSPKPTGSDLIPTSDIENYGVFRPVRRKKVRRPPLRAGIEFYDTGQILVDDAYVDLPWNRKSDYDIVMVNDPEVPRFDFGHFTLTDWATLHTKLFEVPLAQWKNTYRRIEVSDEINIFGVSEYQGEGAILIDGGTVDPANTLSTANEHWKTTYLKSIASYIQVIATGGLALQFDTNNNTTFKCTATYDYDADDVDVTTLNFNRGKIRVYLIPIPLFTSAYQEVGIDAAFRRSILMGHWTVKSREMLMDKTIKRWFNPPYEEIPIFQGYYLSNDYRSDGVWMYDENYIGNDFAEEYINWIKGLDEVELYVQRGTHASGGATFGYESLSNFPFAATGPQDIVGVAISQTNVANVTFTAFGDEGERYNDEGLLQAIVEIGGQFYYIWQTGASFVSTFWDLIQMQTPLES